MGGREREGRTGKGGKVGGREDGWEKGRMGGREGRREGREGMHKGVIHTEVRLVTSEKSIFLIVVSGLHTLA